MNSFVMKLTTSPGIGQNRIDSPIHSLDQAITTLAAMDNIRQQIGVTFNEEQQP